MKTGFVSRTRNVVGAFCVLIGFSSADAQLTVTSPAFAYNDVIPDPFTYSLPGQCNGQNWSPPLQIDNIPAGTQTLAIRLVDPDGGDWLHWKAWDIPVPTGATGVSLPYNAAASVPAAAQASNDFGFSGYGGPCPPTPNHRYVFTVYAIASAVGAGQPSDAALDALPYTRKGSLIGIRSPGDSRPWSPPANTATKTMVEYYFPSLDYYFITSRTSDITLLDSISGWTRTGKSFKVYATQQPNTVALNRYYFDQIALKNSRGSHFYTVVQSEKDTLAALNPSNTPTPRLPYNEGIDSYAFAPAVEGIGGSCAAGHVPVYRVFRGQTRFPDNPNHRFTTDVALYNNFVAAGWDGEGVKFCTPAN